MSILEDETVVISQGLNVRGVDLPQQDFGVLDARVKQTAQYGLLLELKARYEPNGRGF